MNEKTSRCESGRREEQVEEDEVQRLSDEELRRILEGEGTEVIDLDDPRGRIKPTTWHT